MTVLLEEAKCEVVPFEHEDVLRLKGGRRAHVRLLMKGGNVVWIVTKVPHWAI